MNKLVSEHVDHGVKISKRQIIIMIILLVACVVGTMWQSISQRYEAKQFPPVGCDVDVGSYRARCYIEGEGDATIVFITGSGTPCAYTDFYYLQQRLSQYGQTLSYDHAGFGWSSPTDEPRAMDNLVAELTCIIDETASNEDIIIVSHSLGVLEAIGFAQRHPDRVAGIVSLDGGSPEYYRRYKEAVPIVMNRLSAVLRVSGINRLLGEVGVLLPLYGEASRNRALPKEIQSLDKAMYYRYMGSYENLANLTRIQENAKTVLSGEGLGDVPMLVLSSDNGPDWQEVQSQLANWSTASEQITIPRAQHYMHWSNPEEVVRHIEAFVSHIMKEKTKG